MHIMMICSSFMRRFTGEVVTAILFLATRRRVRAAGDLVCTFADNLLSVLQSCCRLNEHILVHRKSRQIRNVGGSFLCPFASQQSSP